MPERVLLVGMMGVGKTTVGELLAARLGWPHHDSDAQVERNTGRTVPDILRADGEAAFRAEEKKALATAATSDAPAVVSVAGGAVLDAGNRKLMREAGFVVWLRASLPTMAERVGTGEGRPLLDDNPDPAAALARIYESRVSLYEEVADVVVDVDDLVPEAVVERILAARP